MLSVNFLVLIELFLLTMIRNQLTNQVDDNMLTRCEKNNNKQYISNEKKEKQKAGCFVLFYLEKDLSVNFDLMKLEL